MIRIYMINRTQHIFRTWVHCLSTLDNIIDTKSTENLIHSLSNGYRDKSHVFAWLVYFWRSFLFFLFLSKFFSIFNQLFLMFLTHIVNFDLTQRTMCQSLLNCKTRIVGMYVSLYDLIVRNNHDRITN